MTSIEGIITTVNRTLPNHERGLIDPTAVWERRAGNCFALTSIVGAAILSRELATDKELFMLIGIAHGFEMDPQGHWLGHTGMVYDPADGSEGALVEVIRNPVGHYVHTSQLPSSWMRGARPQDQPLIHLPGFLRRATTPRMQIINAACDRYLAAPFLKAVIAYQKTHPDFEHDPFEPAQYSGLYDRLEHSLESGELQPERPTLPTLGPVGDDEANRRVNEVVARAFKRVWPTE